MDEVIAWVKAALMEWWWRRQLEALYRDLPSFKPGDEVRPGVWLWPDGSERTEPPSFVGEGCAWCGGRPPCVRCGTD